MKWRLGLSGADDNNTCLIRPEWGADDDDGHHMVGAQEFVKKYGKFQENSILGLSLSPPPPPPIGQ